MCTYIDRNILKLCVPPAADRIYWEGGLDQIVSKIDKAAWAAILTFEL